MFESGMGAYCQFSQESAQSQGGAKFSDTPRVAFGRHRVETFEDQELIGLHVSQEVPAVRTVVVNIVSFCYKVCVDVVAGDPITQRIDG